MPQLKLNTSNYWLNVFSLGVPLNFNKNDLKEIYQINFIKSIKIPRFFYIQYHPILLE